MEWELDYIIGKMLKYNTYLSIDIALIIWLFIILEKSENHLFLEPLEIFVPVFIGIIIEFLYIFTLNRVKLKIKTPTQGLITLSFSILIWSILLVKQSTYEMSVFDIVIPFLIGIVFEIIFNLQRRFTK